MSVDVYMDHVIIEGQTIKRPSYIGRKQWLDYWETKQLLERYECQYCGMTTKA